jgi:hypothetical protein
LPNATLSRFAQAGRVVNPSAARFAEESGRQPAESNQAEMTQIVIDDRQHQGKKHR